MLEEILVFVKRGKRALEQESIKTFQYVKPFLARQIARHSKSPIAQIAYRTNRLSLIPYALLTYIIV